MSDELVGRPPEPSLTVRAIRAIQPGLLERRHCLVLIAIVAVFIGGYFWTYEGSIENILFTAGITLAIAALITMLTRRPTFAAVVTALLTATVVWASSVKRATMDMIVHAYDLFFYMSSWSTVSFLLSDYPGLVAKALFGAALIFALGFVLYRVDILRVARRSAALGLVCAVGLSTLGWSGKGERRHMQFYFSNMYISSFYASWGETLSTLWNGTMMEAAPRSEAAALAIPDRCLTPRKPPHIVLIHQESVVQPSLFPTLSYDRSVDAMFKSQDGLTHKLRVETYGGASWLTEFSILAGVSTQAFGGMRQFVQTFTVNKLKDTLPQRLAQCGYRNVVFYPMLRNFVSNDRFYASIGLEEIFDMKAQGAPTTQQRDRFYFDNAMAEMQRHVATSSKPMFTYIQTMSAHWPYDWTFEPETKAAGGGPGTNPEMHEYLRRVSMAKLDYDYLMAELKRRFPNERILVVQYGDHHPSATRTLVGYTDDVDFEALQADADHPAFITYYAADGINYAVPPLPVHDAVDIPYLGLIIQQSAGLPLSDANRERARLMSICAGRYDSCPRRSEILSFHRRLIDGGIIVAR
jgi:phosphoglycerol transferase MdoB-like AlkP superfamily enzyme